MRRPQVYVLFPAADSISPWRVGVCRADRADLHPVALTPANPPDAEAPLCNVVRAMAQLGYTGQPVVLALPGKWCLAATFPTGDLPRRGSRARRRALLLFRLEEHLPIAVELMAAEFVQPRGGPTTEDGEQTLGVAAEASKIAELLQPLHKLGVTVDYVCPVFLLAAQELMLYPDNQLYRLITCAQQGGNLDVLVCDAARPVHWAQLRPAGQTPAEACLPVYLDTVLQHARGEAALSARGSTPDAEARCRRISNGDESADVAAVRMAGRIAQGSAAPWINLLRLNSGMSAEIRLPNRLRHVRKPLAAAVAALFLLIVSAAVALEVRARAYDRLSTKFTAEQLALCRVATGRSPPLGLTAKARLLNEVRMLAASGIDRGTASSDWGGASLPRVPILSSLGNLLVAWQSAGHGEEVDQPRYRLIELECAPDHLLLQGESRAHSDADALAENLQRYLGQQYVIDGLRTTMQDANNGGRAMVGFTITATAPVSVRPPEATQ